MVIPAGISEVGPRKLPAMENQRSKPTVEQFYICRHGIRLRHPFIPCIIEERGNNHVKYYPIELIYVYEWDQPFIYKENIFNMEIIYTHT